ncbi:hypothetical protein [Alteromonas halophila]|uniref:Fis family transcriptional regulator n=1 Tax=Alteromonas halophila TaxID=516698 RepID=A0A918MYI8_9ALTE|nr:hypothetical protein [Alteromonas halophila]GGW83416.1 hypothetical protein GCM10007391_16110 [Alteromonas halophila]
MKKSDKKMDNAISSALTDACEAALETHNGFVWLTHVVNYRRFPQSLLIICVFDTQANLEQADTQAMRNSVYEALLSINVRLSDRDRQIAFDTEEACEAENQGNWARRLAVA